MEKSVVCVCVWGGYFLTNCSRGGDEEWQIACSPYAPVVHMAFESAIYNVLSFHCTSKIQAGLDGGCLWRNVARC